MREQRPVASVYAIGTIGGKLVKIGYGTQVAKRLGVLRAASPLPLTLLWHTAGPRALEQHLHRVFRDRRRHAEWFEFREADALALIRAAAEEFLSQSSRSTSTPVTGAAASPPATGGAPVGESAKAAVLLAVTGIA